MIFRELLEFYLENNIIKFCLPQNNIVTVEFNEFQSCLKIKVLFSKNDINTLYLMETIFYKLYSKNCFLKNSNKFDNFLGDIKLLNNTLKISTLIEVLISCEIIEFEHRNVIDLL